MGLGRAALCTMVALVVVGLAVPALSPGSPVVLPGSVLKPGGVSGIEVVAPRLASSCSVRFAGGRRYGPYRVPLGGPTRVVRWKTPRSARGKWTATVACRDATGGSVGTAKVPLVIGRRARPRGRLVKPGSLRVVRGSIPELAARPGAAPAQLGDDVNTSNPLHQFVACGGDWVATTRTTGDGLGTYIQFEPTGDAREIWNDPRAFLGQHIPAYSEMWEELNRCANFTPDLDDIQRHSLYVQMACHARWGARFMRGGNTWDLEAWRQDVTWDFGLSFDGRCGESYGNVPKAEVDSFLLGRLVNEFLEGIDLTHRKAWLVEKDGSETVRRHVRTTTAYDCLVDAGHPPAQLFAGHFLEIVTERGEKNDANSCPQPEPEPQPEPQPGPQPTPAPRTWPEQQGSLGANTFTNPYNASGMGTKIQPYQWVEVACKVYAPQIASANPDGYWYRIASAPWNGAYYAVANTFWNGDIPGQRPYTHNTDFSVPNC